MHFSPSSILAMLTVTLAFASVHASPRRFRDDDLAATARSMLGPNVDAVSWDTLPLERSPSDPDSMELEKRIVYNPPVTYPSKSTVWTAGQHVHVEWTIDQENLPENAKDPNAKVMLGYLLRGGDYNEHLNWTLAENFPIADGKVSFTLPSNLMTRNDYIVVLFGDSGNRSKRFTIKTKPTQSTQVTADDSEQGQDTAGVDASNVVVKAKSSLLGRDLA